MNFIASKWHTCQLIPALRGAYNLVSWTYVKGLLPSLFTMLGAGMFEKKEMYAKEKYVMEPEFC